LVKKRKSNNKWNSNHNNLTSSSPILSQFF
jgi:hypothetical protein